MKVWATGADVVLEPEVMVDCGVSLASVEEGPGVTELSEVAGAEVVEAGAELGVLEGDALVDCSEAVVDPAVVDAGAEDDESAVVDSAVELDASLELVSEAVVDPAPVAVEDCASVVDCAGKLVEPGAVLDGPAAVVELLLLGPLSCLLAI